MNNNDINDLLTAFDNPNHCYPQDLVDAIRLLVKERDNARRDVLAHIAELKAKINILTAERDEARRMVCEHDETIGGAMIKADLLGWDCYKEDK